MNRIKSLRKERGMSQDDVAKVLNRARTAIGKYENGDLDLGTEAIVRLCEIFDCTSDYLLGISEQRHYQISDADARLVQAYHDADDDHKLIVDTALGLHSVRPQSKSEAS